MRPQADVLLVTVTKVETEAMLRAAREQTGHEPTLRPIGRKTYFDLGSIRDARVWLVRSEMGAGGLGASLQTITKAIAALGPGAVIMVGIAFGMNESRQAIGDVLVSEGLRLYDLQRVGSADGQVRIILRGDRPHASTWLLDRLRTAELGWNNATVRFGLVFSGEKLIDNLGYREQLRALEPEAVGGEMEGGGLYVACHDEKVDWILVKGICDWADGNKEVDRAPRQALAARNSAGFIMHVLQQAPLRRESPARRSPPARATRKSPSGGQRRGRPTGGIHVAGNRNVIAGDGGLAIGGDIHGDVTIH